jgi:hypothetical protein
MTEVLVSAGAPPVLAACSPPAASPPASEALTPAAVSQLVVSDGFARETPQAAPHSRRLHFFH